MAAGARRAGAARGCIALLCLIGEMWAFPSPLASPVRSTRAETAASEGSHDTGSASGAGSPRVASEGRSLLASVHPRSHVVSSRPSLDADFALSPAAVPPAQSLVRV